MEIPYFLSRLPNISFPVICKKCFNIHCTALMPYIIWPISGSHHLQDRFVKLRSVQPTSMLDSLAVNEWPFRFLLFQHLQEPLVSMRLTWLIIVAPCEYTRYIPGHSSFCQSSQQITQRETNYKFYPYLLRASDSDVPSYTLERMGLWCLTSERAMEGH